MLPLARRAMPLPEFQLFQYAFTAHLRDPQNSTRPQGVDARRMAIYSGLLYNNIEGFLLACFPVLRSVLGKPKWAALVQAFFKTHRCHTPYFRQIPDEFIQYLQTKWQRPEAYPEYVRDLAHYEWMELVLAVSNRTPDWARIAPEGNLLAQRPVLNPVLANLFYRWPVQRIRPRADIALADTYLLVFRDAGDQIQFVETNAFTARLMSLLEAGTLTGRAALTQIATESDHPLPAVIQGGESTLQNLHARGAILGVATET